MCLACSYCLAEYFPGAFLYMEINSLILQALFVPSGLFNIASVIFAIANFFRMSSARNFILDSLR